MAEKNNKKLAELLESLAKDYEKIKFIIEEEDYEQSDKFREFLLALERQNDLDVFTHAWIYILTWFHDCLYRKRCWKEILDLSILNQSSMRRRSIWR